MCVRKTGENNRQGWKVVKHEGERERGEGSHVSFYWAGDFVFLARLHRSRVKGVQCVNPPSIFLMRAGQNQAKLS
jgi:hypothetical protein